MSSTPARPDDSHVKAAAAYVVPRPTEENITEILSELPQVAGGVLLCHWPWVKALLVDSTRAQQVARISGTVGVSARHVADLADGAERLRLACEACATTRAHLTVNYSPWHQRGLTESRGWDQAATDEVSDARRCFGVVRQGLEEFNSTSAKEVLVDHVFLDQEILRADLDEDGKPDPAGGQREDQAAAMRLKNDIIWDVVSATLGGSPAMSYHGQLWGHHAPGERTQGWADIECYNGRDYAAQRGTYARLTAAIDAANISPPPPRWRPMPYIGLAGYYDAGPRTPAAWVETPSAVAQTWRLGQRALHPYFRAKYTDDRWGDSLRFGIWPSRNTLSWWAHYIALIAGAGILGDSEDGWLDKDLF